MKKRLICLFLCILMIVPVCLMAGCAEKTDEEVNSDIEEEASESTVTLAMYLMSEQDVCTAEELAKIKDKHGAGSPEYIEAKAVYDVHEKVEAEMNKITKAKFKTQVNVYWYTSDEYYDIIEKKMDAYEKEVLLKDEAKKAYDKFKKEQLDLGATSELEIKKLFDEKYPEYAPYVTVKLDPDETTAETAEETVRTESGIIELKYPEEGKNQVDIIYLGGYDLYNKYINNGWLQPLDSEFSSTAKSLNAYINAAFFDAMSVDGVSYAVPTNSLIGEYTYMLINKELYEDYGYLGQHDDIQSEITSIADIYEFIAEIGDSDLDVVPFTGSLETSGTHFWSVDYEYKLQKDLKSFEEGKYYYTKNTDGSYAQVGKYVDGMEYFTLDPTTNHFVALTGDSFDATSDYYIIDPSAYAKSNKFVEGVTYYTKDAKGNFVVAEGITGFESGVDYYKIASKYFVKINTSSYKANEGVTYYVKADNEYKKVTSLESFTSGTAYYVVRDAFDAEDDTLVPMYSVYGEYEDGKDYYVAEITFKADDFSLVGSSVAGDADEETKLGFNNIFSEDMDYAEQIIAIKNINTNGYYDADAINKGKAFAAAIVKGGADLVTKYSDDYISVVIDAPTADFSKMYDHLFAVPTASANLSRAMEVITLLNTDAEFRNLVQYGIVEESYSVSTVEINGKNYPQIKRLNNYYMMDINKTGNLFVAYPEEGMNPYVWEFAKMQNRDSRRDVLSGFNINSMTSPDLDLLDEIAAMSDEWKAKLDACEDGEALEKMIDELRLQIELDETLKRLISPTEDDERSLNIIYNTWYSKTYEPESAAK